MTQIEGLHAENEARVEAETVCRVSQPKSKKGYYARIKQGKAAVQLKKEDKALLQSSKETTCLEKVEDKLDETHIGGTIPKRKGKKRWGGAWKSR